MSVGLKERERQREGDRVERNSVWQLEKMAAERIWEVREREEKRWREREEKRKK